MDNCAWKSSYSKPFLIGKFLFYKTVTLSVVLVSCLAVFLFFLIIVGAEDRATSLVPLLRDCFRNICFHTLEKIETHLFFSLPPERASDVQTKTLGFWCRGSIFHWQHNQSIDQPSNLDWSLAKPQPSYPTKVGPQLTTAKDNNIGVLVTWIHLSHRSPAVPNHRPTEQIRLVSRQTKPYTSNPTKNLPIQRQIYTKQRLYIC